MNLEFSSTLNFYVIIFVIHCWFLIQHFQLEKPHTFILLIKRVLFILICNIATMLNIKTLFPFESFWVYYIC